MARPERGTVRDLRRGNRAVLLRSLYFDGPSSRRELSRLTGLSAATVSNVIGDLVTDGIVEEVGAIESDGGRPQILLRVAPDYAHVIGVDVGETRVRVELFDLMLREQAKAEYELRRGRHDARLVVRHIAAGLETVLGNAGLAEENVLGVGIGVPGVVGPGPQQLVDAPTLGWGRVPLATMLRAGTGLPLFVDNGATSMGQAELWFGAGRGARHAVITLIGTGVGASVITDGLTYRGATNSAGEWGHTTIAFGGRACRCGARGCLEAYVGAEGILARYAEARSGRGMPEAGDEESALAALLASAERTKTARRVVDTTVGYLGAGLGLLINLFNPERVVLGGWAGLLLGRQLLPAIRAATEEHALAQPFGHAAIELGQLGPDAVALGAASTVVDHFLLNSTTFRPGA